MSTHLVGHSNNITIESLIFAINSRDNRSILSYSLTHPASISKSYSFELDRPTDVVLMQILLSQIIFWTPVYPKESYSPLSNCRGCNRYGGSEIHLK